jgi:hypothetical protein
MLKERRIGVEEPVGFGECKMVERSSGALW